MGCKHQPLATTSLGLQVNVPLVIQTLKQNSEKAVRLLLSAIPCIAREDWTKTIENNKVRLIYLEFYYNAVIHLVRCCQGSYR